jgi:uncharacterized protein with ATP-grasp and redox domains
MLSDDDAFRLNALKQVARYAVKANFNDTPAALSKPIYKKIARACGISDPYGEQKRSSNLRAIKLLPQVSKYIAKNRDSLQAALHVAAAGNIIDFGIAGHSFNIEREFRKVMQQKFAINAIKEFRKELKKGNTILYICDNSGEIVFDTLLIKELLKFEVNVTAVVKAAPIINDATFEDAKMAGMTKLVPVITTGGDDVGINWKNVSKKFMAYVKKADCIIAKGQGNFETCNERKENFFFLLKAKCPVVARELKARLYDLIFWHNRVDR